MNIRLKKMKTELTSGLVEYSLEGPGTEFSLKMTKYLGKKIKLSFSGQISCLSCDAKMKKSFQNGHCYPCFQSLAECDSCMMRPETCHFEKGTCRDESFAQKHCFIPHVVYLADSSSLKVGITRAHQKQTRWMDQGATKAVAIWQTETRKEAGDVEVFLKNYIGDKTNWRNMLKGLSADEDLDFKRDEILEICESADLPGEPLDEEDICEIEFPVKEFPEKVTSLNLDKNPLVEGVLQGVKGQYLILDTGVINIRRHGGYHVEFSSAE